jgi:hypothetical protein
MEKILALTEEQFNLVKDNLKKDQVSKEVNSLLGIEDKIKIGIGDSVALIGTPSKPMEVYKYQFGIKGTDSYLIVIDPMDDKLALCYTVYLKENAECFE